MICPKVMLMLYPLNEAVRSGGDLRNAGGSDHSSNQRYENNLIIL